MKIYTDGSTNKISGVAFVATNHSDEIICIKSKCIETKDNNTAELAAVAFALEEFKDSFDNVIILTDSMYVINCIKKNRCRPGEEDFFETIKKSKEMKKVNFMWVKAHTKGNNYIAYFNDIADRESRAARIRHQKEKYYKNKLPGKFPRKSRDLY